MTTYIKEANINNAYRAALGTITLLGDKVCARGEETKELSNVIIEITKPCDRGVFDDERKLPMRTQVAEFCWYMTGSPDVRCIKKYIPGWAMCADKDGMANSNYGMYWKAQFGGLIKKLEGDGGTRQAVVSIYDGNKYLNYNGRDTPCAIAQTFNIRKNLLNSTVMMRSNDIIRGFCLDAFCFTAFQELVRNELVNNGYGVCGMGGYVHHAVSMHLYKDHWDIGMGKNQEDADARAIRPTTTFSNFWEAKDPYFFGDDGKRTVDYDDFVDYIT